MGERDLLIELDGPGVSPETLDSFVALEVASAYLDLLRRLAEDIEQSITFTGLRVEDKCAAIAIGAEPIALARELSTRALEIIRTGDTEVFGAEGPASRVRDGLRKLPDEITANVIVGDWRAPMHAHFEPVFPYVESLTQMRVKPLRVGGAKTAVRMEAVGEDGAFTLRCTEDMARHIGPHLYTEVDIVARIFRTSDGRIEGGAMEEFHPLNDVDPIESWRGWFRDSCSPLNDVEDLERELRG